MQAIKERMTNLRENAPKMLGGMNVLRVHDYQTQRTYNVQNNTSDRLALPISNVLQFITADGSKVTVRPSGTEPKIKFYFSVCESVLPEQNLQEVDDLLKERIAGLKKDLGLC